MLDHNAYASLVLAAWEKFIETGKIETTEIRPEITQSWLRCRKAGVDPFAGRSTRLLPEPEVNELLEKRKSLINIARPFMEKLYDFVISSHFVVVLCDERGYIMETVGNTYVTKYYARDLNFYRGALWTEEEIGGNGVGTTLLLKRPFQISGAEHYCKKHHPWTCSGAPIFNEENQLIGILEMSGPVEKTHLHTLGMVVAAAEAIKQQLRVHQRNRQLTLVNNRLNNIFLSVSDGVIVVDRQGIIKQVNPVAEKILGQEKAGINNSMLEDYLERYTPVRDMLTSGKAFSDLEVAVKTTAGIVQCLASGKSIRDDQDKITGGVIFINPIHRIKNLINRFSGAHATFSFEDILGNGKLLLKAIQLGSLAAGNHSNVLLCGESGTGKEMFAQAIHNKSTRSSGPFVAVNCGAIPRELIGSELFGYAEGAFTGARKGGRPGKFELAVGGTLFLDEIGDMPLEQQVSLLRVLQDKTITRIGGDKVVVVDVRIICATNKNLSLEVAKGNFRQDLYYRLNVISITLPALREHREDIPPMFKAFFKKSCEKLGRVPPDVDPKVITCLQQYGWPGNVRELQNVVERMVNVATGPVIRTDHLPEEILSPQFMVWQRETGWSPQSISITEERKKIKERLAENQREEILTLLSKNKGNVSQVAREMGISRNSLYRKLKKLNILL
ncbi:sigma-54-dependent Fis family transcriptional regulator [Desulforamulus ruminis]|uniref:PAS sensor protein n=1 Tax=Desulforamulus ruminis (strain ATCC 23193 / DSM 2154 / NCIMB 8452 / DL) TaxID=696281 RepID=F6DMF1_DESRL|nr:sigma-54-dependent Fis family transcriptional regulator [Desulforamulus ruminis]AEG61712.1 PAS sensor protein [Desulforamulus ruminis DSM 2154]